MGPPSRRPTLPPGHQGGQQRLLRIASLQTPILPKGNQNRKAKEKEQKQMPDYLFQQDIIHVFGEKFTGLSVNEGAKIIQADAPAAYHYASSDGKSTYIARIFGYIYQGKYEPLSAQLYMYVVGDGELVAADSAQFVAADAKSIPEGSRFWKFSRRDITARIDLETTAPVEAILFSRRKHQTSPHMTVKSAEGMIPAAASSEVKPATEAAGAERAAPTIMSQLTHISIVVAGMILLIIFGTLVLGMFWAGFMARFDDHRMCCPVCGPCSVSQDAAPDKTPTASVKQPAEVKP
jgi:hypothetical protein